MSLRHIPIIALVVFLGIVLYPQQVFSKPIYKCIQDNVVTYKHSPCLSTQQQKVACLGYGGGVDFETTLKARCLNSDKDKVSEFKSSSTYHPQQSVSSRYSNYIQPKTKKQYVSGYTRRDGRYVKPYMRSGRR